MGSAAHLSHDLRVQDRRHGLRLGGELGTDGTDGTGGGAASSSRGGARGVGDRGVGAGAGAERGGVEVPLGERCLRLVGDPLVLGDRGEVDEGLRRAGVKG